MISTAITEFLFTRIVICVSLAKEVLILPFEIKVINDYSEFAGVSFGPFKTKKQAANRLRSKGWMENINGEKGLWYAIIDQYTSINAIIRFRKNPKIGLRNPKKLPSWFNPRYY